MRGSTAGLTTLKGNSILHYRLLSVLDSLFSCLIVAPAVISYWRSVWELMEIYVFPQNELVSALISLAIGYMGQLILMLLQNVLEKYFHPDKKRIVYYTSSRIYTFFYGFICVNGWRGPWIIIHKYSDKSWETTLSLTLAGVFLLGFIKGLRNVAAPPFVLLTDYVVGYFKVLTYFRKEVRNLSLFFFCLLHLGNETLVKK